MTDQPVALASSRRDPLPGARRVGDAPDDERVAFTIVVRRKPGGEQRALEAAKAGAATGSLDERRRRLVEESGADEADLARVRRFVTESGMRVESADAATRSVDAEGTVAQVNAAFGVSLGRYEVGGLAYRGREGTLRLPSELAGAVEAVLGLDDRPQAHPHLKRGAPLAAEDLPDAAAEPLSLLPALGAAEAAARRTRPQPQPMWPTQVASLYGFPTDVDGSGETIALIELGGGFRTEELATYFGRLGIEPPVVEAVGVGGASNDPGVDQDADGEVMLDIEVAGAVAPGARIVVYFGATSDRAFRSVLAHAIHDTRRNPSIVSISWGKAEEGWSAQGRRAFDGLLLDAAALGITVLTAAGDHGAGDGGPDGRAHADFPASSPHILGCGGTTLFADGARASEVVWNDGDGWATGGGISAVYEPPPWQNVAMPPSLDGGGPGRGVPDVAGNADIASGYIVLCDGRWGPTGGTSAVAPLYAGLVALLNQSLGRPVGWLAPLLYAMPAARAATVLRDVTVGDNTVPASSFGPATDGYEASTGWDACTGLGSIDGTALRDYLRTLHTTAPAPAAVT